MVPLLTVLQSPTHRSLFPALIGLHIAVPVVKALGGGEAIAEHLLIDDSFYYLQTAWNFPRLGFVTFDEINVTNGVQFLWFVLLTVISWLSPSKEALLLLAVLLSTGLSAVPYFIALRLAPHIDNKDAGSAALLIAAGWFVTCQMFPRFAYGAMEAPLHSAVAWLCLYAAVLLLKSGAPSICKSGSIGYIFVSFLILNTWSRLDSAVYSAILLIGVELALIRQSVTSGHGLLERSGHGAWRPCGSLIGLIGAGAAVQFGFFRSAGDTWVPISALVKNATMSQEGGRSLFEASFVLMPYNFIYSPRLAGVSIVAFCVVFVLLWFRKHWLWRSLAPEMATALALVAAGMTLHFIALTGVFHRYYWWYLSWTFLFWCVVTPALMLAVGSRIPALMGRRPPVVALVAILALSGGVFLNLIYRADEPFYRHRLDAARYLKTHSEPDAIVAAWNAGQLAFFSDRRVINLDGLINNGEFLERVLRHPGNLRVYLEEKGVGYLADYSFQYFEKDYQQNGGFELVREFPLDGAATLKIVRLLPTSWSGRGP